MCAMSWMTFCGEDVVSKDCPVHQLRTGQDLDVWSIFPRCRGEGAPLVNKELVTIWDMRCH